jgi:hypothetical protein
VSPRTPALVAVSLLMAALCLSYPAHAGPTSGACRDGAYTLTQSVWKTTYRWHFLARSTPPGVNAKAAAGALQRAANNITNGRNSCGFPDRIGARQQYVGTTRAPINISNNGSCESPDGQSVVGFGPLATGALGITCFWIRDGRTAEADVLLNKGGFRWAAHVGPGCLGAWSIEDVATHEFGHAFGLGHVTEQLHGALTMSPAIRPCQLGETTLGLGDIKGLRAKY